MKPRTTLILLMVLVVLATLVYLLEKPFGQEASPEQEATLFFPDFDPQKLERIHLESSEQTTELFLAEGRWEVLDQGTRFPADPRLVDKIIEQVAALERQEVVSQNEAKHSLFQVDSSGLRAQFFAGESSVADFFLGKNGPDFFSTYVRRQDETQVYLLADYIRSGFDKPARNWKDRSPLKAEKEEIQSILIQRREGGEIRFDRGVGEAWTLQAGDRTGPVREREINRLLSGLSNFLASDYAELGEEAETGLEDPAVRVTLTLEDGTSQTALLGGEAEDNRYYAQSEGSDWILLMPKHRYDLLVKDAEEYLEPTPVPTEPSEVPEEPAAPAAGTE